MEKLKFKILTEDVEVGKSINPAQENIADGIVNIIRENEQASTIGLQGPWGSGKSTIIKEVQNKLKDANEYIYFYFDAWAHEGDLLRKIFLVKLIDEIINVESETTKKDNTSMQSIKVKKNKILNILSPSLFQIILVISTLIVPFGTELISASKNDNFEFITSTSLVGIFFLFYLFLFLNNKFKNDKTCIYILLKYSPLLIILITTIVLCCNYNCFLLIPTLNLLFSLGCLLSLAPIIVILLHFVGEFKTDRVYLEIKFDFLSAFLNGNLNESTSIDFEQYFNEILELYPQNKFIIVIDNLDRIDHDDAKKLWSTLQIFLQHRNPASNPESTELYKNLWLIIPYDHDSLIKIWNSNDSNTNNSDTNKPQIETYLEKCFQIRFDVPKMTINDWVNITENLVKSAFLNIPKNIMDEIIYTLQMHQKNNYDNPYPRSIKLYINQIGIYYSSTSIFFKDKSFPFRSLSFFIINKYLENLSNQTILNSLISSKYEEVKVKYNLEEEYIENLACFSYFIEPNKAVELFIENKLTENLYNSKHEELKIQASNFPYSFWLQFEKINKDDFAFLIHLPIIYTAFWEMEQFSKSKDQIKVLIKKVSKPDSNFIQKLSSNENQKYYNALDCIIEIYRNDNQLDYIATLISTIGNQNKDIEIELFAYDYNKEIEWIKTCYNYLLDKCTTINFQENKPNFELSNTIFTLQFLRHWDKKHIEFFKISELFHFKVYDNLINTNNIIPVFMLKNYVNYCIFTKYELSNKFVTDVLNNLENSMSNESTKDNLDTIDVLISLFNTQKYNGIMEEHFKSFNLAPIISTLIIDEETKTKVCFLYGMLSPGTEIFQDEEKLEVREFWMNRDGIKADLIVPLINKIENPINIKAKLWNLTKYNYLLIIDILLNKDLKTNYFELDNFFENLNGILKLEQFTYEEIISIVSKCFENTHDIILEIQNLDNIIHFPEVYLYLVDIIPQFEKEKLIEFIKNENFDDKIKTKLLQIKYKVKEQTELLDNQLKLIKKLGINNTRFT